MPARRARSTRSPDPLRPASSPPPRLRRIAARARPHRGAATGLWLAASCPSIRGEATRPATDHRAPDDVDELPSILLWAAVSTAITASLLGLTPAGFVADASALAVLGIAVFATASLRALARVLWRRLTPPERVLMIGRSELTQTIRRKLELFPDIHVTVIGERDDIGPEELVEAPAWLDGVDRVIVAAEGVEHGLARLVALCRQEGVKLSIVPPAQGFFGTTVQLTYIADLPVVECLTWDFSRSTLLLKRTLDLGVATPLLLVLTPLMALIGGLVRLESHGPALFVQQRAGCGGRPFRIMKFRTMMEGAEEWLSELVAVDELEQPMFKLRDDPRVTRFGQWLRRTSLDELPQLLNVLRGDMSLVGPRPEQMELVERYREEHLFRLAVKPGLTGPMQVYGRGGLTFEERLSVEREYVENLSVGRDLRILALTVAAVAGGRGAF